MWKYKYKTVCWNLKPTECLCFFLLQYVVIPTRRSTAEALQITFIHLLGDAGSPYLIGLVRCSILPRSLKLYVQLKSTTFSVYISEDKCCLHTCASRFLMLFKNLILWLLIGASALCSTAWCSVQLLGSWVQCFISWLPDMLLKTGRQWCNMSKVHPLEMDSCWLSFNSLVNNKAPAWNVDTVQPCLKQSNSP